MIKNKPLLTLLSALLIATFLMMNMTGVVLAREDEGDDDTMVVQYFTGNTGPLVLPQSGQASLVFFNLNGAGHELIVDLQGAYLKIAAKSGDISPHSQVFVVPGTYAYTASSAEFGSVTRDIQVAAGQVIGLSFQAGPEDDSTVDELADLRVYEDDLTGSVGPLMAQDASTCSPISC